MTAMRLAIPATLDRAAFHGWDPRAETVVIGGDTMGTGWRVVYARPPALDTAALTAAIQALLDTLVDEMSHWAPDAHLARFNRSAPGCWSTLPAAFAAVMAAALEVADQSDGAFDPTIGELVDLWGFGPAPAGPAPDEAAVRAALARCGWRRLAFDPATRRLRQPGGLRLDLSGIAKGDAVDRLAELLDAWGVRHALVEVGGEFAGRGLRPDGDPWWVEAEAPDGCAAPLRIALHQLAIATSGDYVRGCHTIDPRTGRPVTHALGVSVVHRSAMRADAWATALGVAAPAAAMAVATRRDLAARLLWRTQDGVAEWVSPALAAMIEEQPA